jgi:transposase-like protein
MVKDICRLILEEEEPEVFEEVVQYWFEEAVVNDEIGKADKITEYDVEGVVPSPPSNLNSTITTATPTVTTTRKQQYRCEICDYNTDRNAHYLKHLTSNKHFLNSHPIEFDPNCKYQCKNCNKKYRGQSGLWQHSQVCIPVTLSLVIEPTIVEESVSNDSINLETVMNELKKINERIEGLSSGIR